MILVEVVRIRRAGIVLDQIEVVPVQLALARVEVGFLGDGMLAFNFS